jgi:iron complex outermembrane receptor protein
MLQAMKPRAHFRLLCSLLVATGAAASVCAQSLPSLPKSAENPAADTVSRGQTVGVETAVQLDAVQVEARFDDKGYDATGMGSYEQQLRDTPFSNDLIAGDGAEDDPLAIELTHEMQQVARPSAVDLATGDTRLSLRGFPTPMLRNGFVTMGASDMLNTSRTITIQGMLVPVLGRAAPGGIQDFITWRPRTTAGKRFDYSISSLQRQTAAFELTGPAVPKKLWQRVAGDWNRRTGPEKFAATETRTLSAAATWRQSAAASYLLAVDFQQVHATAAPGIPEYRPANGQKIVGPYKPLAGFNAFGPDAGVRRRTGAATLLYDGQPHKQLAVRAGLEAWWRQVEQDRFTTSVYNIAMGRFEGTREPRHLEQPQAVYLAHAEATARFSAWKAEHKVMFAVNHTQGDYEREELALSTAARNALPATVRLFDPDAPDYYRPPFSRELYSRVLADREEKARYTALELSHRLAVAQGKLVFTTGARQDFVSLQVNDRRPGAVPPQVRDAVDQLTYHTGVNYQALPSRLLLFTTWSTAFEPSTRVDARTGRLQPNEMTAGFEAGFKWRLPQPLVEVTATGFSLFNYDIARRNPLYDDPIFDANQTQPQLVASGEETFRGVRLEGRWKPSTPLTVTTRASYARAITTASPDLPEEVGRAITRLPPWNAATSLSYAFGKGRWQGLSLSGSWTYISAFVAQYEDAQRRRLDYPGYGQLGLGANYSLRRGKFTHGFGASVRNALDYDFVAKQDRLGAGREWVGSYRLTF